MTNDTRSLKAVFEEIKQIGSRMQLSDATAVSCFSWHTLVGCFLHTCSLVQQKAMEFYKTFSACGDKTSRGKSHRVWAAAAVYIACKSLNMARSPKGMALLGMYEATLLMVGSSELATYANCTARAVNRATRDMTLVLKQAGKSAQTGVVDPKEYVVRTRTMRAARFHALTGISLWLESLVFPPRVS
jgi:transcription initiation factor TFIIIB Brf1 subunit/transcription initiation factor TFIIB